MNCYFGKKLVNLSAHYGKAFPGGHSVFSILPLFSGIILKRSYRRGSAPVTRLHFAILTAGVRNKKMAIEGNIGTDEINPDFWQIITQ